MSDVFISYSSKNRDIAERVATELQRSGYSIFYDQELAPGDTWSARLAQELNQAKHVLVLLSPAYVKSRWARGELEAAVLGETEGGPKVIPVLVQDTEIPGFLQYRHYADLRADFESGISQLKRALEKRPRQTEEDRARRSRRVGDILSILSSLLAAAVGAIASLVGATGAIIAVSDLSVVAIGVVGLTALVALISLNWPHRKAGPVEAVAREVERVYIDALEESRLNPLSVRGAKNG